MSRAQGAAVSGAREAPAGGPRVAVCVSSRNRSGLLARLVTALEAQTLPAEQFEVVVVDDGSDDDTWQVLTAQAQRSPLALTVLRQETSRGPATGRNRAWRASTAPVVAFTDDDCVPSPHWLESALAVMEQPGRVGPGQVRPNPAQLADFGPFAHTWNMTAAFASLFATANCFYRRADLERVGGFDERYRGAAGEDTELGMRVTAGGAEKVYLADALVYHDVRAGRLRDKLRDQARWVDIPLIFATHPRARREMLYGGVFWKREHLQALLLVAGAALAASSPRRRGAALLGVWWLHERICRRPESIDPGRWYPALPGVLLVDLTELAVAVRGSVRHRTVVL